MVSKKCLLVIDMQVGMFQLPLPLYNAEVVISNIKNLIHHARTANVPVIYVQHCGGEKSRFEKGSEGWLIHPEISPLTKDYVIEKRFSDSFQDTNLDELLRDLKIDGIVVCGLVTEGCVDTTIRRAFSLGYKIIAAGDSHSTTDSKILTADQIVRHHNEVFKIFAEVKVSKDILFGD